MAVPSPVESSEASTARRTAADEAGFYLGPLLRPLLLLLVGEDPAHGYGLVERLGRLGVPPRRANTLYRELHDLEANGLIESSWDASQTRGPPRRIYRLTAAGKCELDAIMPAVASVGHALMEAVARDDARKARRPGN